MNIPEHLHLIHTPVPYPLKFVNCYLAETDRGWSLIDAGCNTQDTKDFWAKTLKEFGAVNGKLTDIYVTHYHPDHLGLAGWLQQEYGAQVHMYGPDRDWAKTQWTEDMEQAYLVEEMYIRNGCPADIASVVRDQFIQQRKDTLPLPENVTEIAEGAKVRFGDAEYEVIWVPGHCDTMISFWDSKNRVFIAADSILPHITPNVGVWPRMRSNPLQDFIDSLRKIKGLNAALTLPGHGKIMEDTSDRAQFIIEHHMERLASMNEMVIGGTHSAFDLAREYFKLTTLTPHQVRFALSETLAHLEYLVAEGKLEKQSGEDVRYLPAQPIGRRG
jgi:glyoxylase-like metal-dependent hydrolase (beta-lactamase superfamily II)